MLAVVPMAAVTAVARVVAALEAALSVEPMVVAEEAVAARDVEMAVGSKVWEAVAEEAAAEKATAAAWAWVVGATSNGLVVEEAMATAALAMVGVGRPQQPAPTRPACRPSDLSPKSRLNQKNQWPVKRST